LASAARGKRRRDDARRIHDASPGPPIILVAAAAVQLRKRAAIFTSFPAPLQDACGPCVVSRIFCAH